jgi:hypothetical protein
MQSECDPHVWLQIENLVRQRLTSPGASPGASAAVSAKIDPQR